MDLHPFLKKIFPIVIKFIQFCRYVISNFSTYFHCMLIIFNTILPLLFSIWVICGWFYYWVNRPNNNMYLMVFQINDSNLSCLSIFCYWWECPLTWLPVSPKLCIDNSFDLRYIFSLALLFSSTLTINIRVQTTLLHAWESLNQEKVSILIPNVVSMCKMHVIYIMILTMASLLSLLHSICSIKNHFFLYGNAFNYYLLHLWHEFFGWIQHIFWISLVQNELTLDWFLKKSTEELLPI